MELTIGRDAATSQLAVFAEGQHLRLGVPGSVPKTVSRQHCSLKVNADGTMTIRSLKADNPTYINGMPVEQKHINKNDIVELGPDHYRLDVAAVRAMADKLTPKYMDIRPLRKLYEDYEQQTLKMAIAERRFNALRSATGLITMIAIVMSITVGRGPVYLVLYGTAIVVSLAFTIKAYRASSSMPKKKKELEKSFQAKYKCSNCNHQYKMNYDELAQYDACPFCKAKFIK